LDAGFSKTRDIQTFPASFYPFEGGKEANRDRNRKPVSNTWRTEGRLKNKIVASKTGKRKSSFREQTTGESQQVHLRRRGTRGRGEMNGGSHLLEGEGFSKISGGKAQLNRKIPRKKRTQWIRADKDKGKQFHQPLKENFCNNGPCNLGGPSAGKPRKKDETGGLLEGGDI